MRLVVWMVVIAACRDEARPPNKHDTPPAAITAPRTDAATAALVDAAGTGACTTSFDCGENPLGPSDCMHSCSDGRCVLFVTVRGAGDACGGERDGDEYQRVAGPTTATRIGFCDVSRGLYCDHGRCAARKPAGSRCRREDAQDGFECVNGAYCDDATETCKPAPGVGGECGLAVVHRCATNAYCDPNTMRCKARRRDGACAEGIECSSNYCDPETLRCAKKPPAPQPCSF
jgi:hypothetical protein